MSKSTNTVVEQYLLDTIDRISRNPEGYAALYIYVSKLKPKNRHPAFLKVFAKFFDSLATSAKGALYVLSNGDFVILGRGITQEIADAAILNI